MTLAVGRGGGRVAWILVATAVGCSGDGFEPTGPGRTDTLACSIPPSQIIFGGPGMDGIPALTDPDAVPVGSPTADYLLDTDRVIGVAVGDELLAIPLNIMWWHEIVNLDIGGRRLAVTHCPLTGSSLAFDREPLGGVEFGVSGLLFRNNLIMYDRSEGESLWPQMIRGARCGARDGAALTMFPVIEMTWLGWRTLHPNTLVVSAETNYLRDYAAYPYGDYDVETNPERLFPGGNLDPRRPPKERILGVPDGEGGTAYPFGELRRLGPTAAVHRDRDVVFWDAQRQAAMVFVPEVDGQPLAFRGEDLAIVDDQTGSVWTVDGRAVSGPLAGRRLEPVAEAYVAFWFAWADFHANTLLWEAP